MYRDKLFISLPNFQDDITQAGLYLQCLVYTFISMYYEKGLPTDVPLNYTATLHSQTYAPGLKCPLTQMPSHHTLTIPPQKDQCPQILYLLTAFTMKFA